MNNIKLFENFNKKDELNERIDFSHEEKEKIVSSLEQIELNLYDAGVKEDIVSFTRTNIDNLISMIMEFKR